MKDRFTVFSLLDCVDIYWNLFIRCKYSYRKHCHACDFSTFTSLLIFKTAQFNGRYHARYLLELKSIRNLDILIVFELHILYNNSHMSTYSLPMSQCDTAAKLKPAYGKTHQSFENLNLTEQVKTIE